MRKLLIALSFSLPLLIVSCDPVEVIESIESNNSGFWEVQCTSVDATVDTENCDSVWISYLSDTTYKDDCQEKVCNDPVITLFDPVCGCNNVTYSNKSEAECKGIINYTLGACENK